MVVEAVVQKIPPLSSRIRSRRPLIQHAAERKDRCNACNQAGNWAWTSHPPRALLVRAAGTSIDTKRPPSDVAVHASAQACDADDVFTSVASSKAHCRTAAAGRPAAPVPMHCTLGAPLAEAVPASRDEEGWPNATSSGLAPSSSVAARVFGYLDATVVAAGSDHRCPVTELPAGPAHCTSGYPDAHRNASKQAQLDEEVRDDGNTEVRVSAPFDCLAPSGMGRGIDKGGSIRAVLRHLARTAAAARVDEPMSVLLSQ